MLKTVQEMLLECDRNLLADMYCNLYGPSVFSLPGEYGCTVADVCRRLRQRVFTFLDYFDSVEAKVPEKGHEMYLLAYHVIPSANDPNDVLFTAVCRSDFDKDCPSRCSVILEDSAVLASYYVSDAYTTQYYIHELLAWFVYEASFFGWQREGVSAQREELSCRLSQVSGREGAAVSFDGYVPSEETDVHEDNPDEDGGVVVWCPENRNSGELAAEQALFRQMEAFATTCLVREIRAISIVRGVV